MFDLIIRNEVNLNLMLMFNDCKKVTSNKLIYIDQLTVEAVLILIKNKSRTNVILLEALKPSHKIWLFILNLKRINIIEANFFAGELKLPDNQSVMLKAQTVAGEISFGAAKQVIDSEPELQKLNKLYGRNTIQLFIAKQLYYHIAYWTTRVMISQVLCRDGDDFEIWLKKPYQFNSQFIINNFPEVNVNFYSAKASSYYQLVVSFLMDMARDFRLITRGKFKQSKNQVKYGSKKPSVLLMQEDNIHADISLRGQPHWLELSKSNDVFDTYIIELLSPKVSVIKDLDKLNKSNIYTIPTFIFTQALSQTKESDVLQQLRKNRLNTYLALFKTQSFSGKFYLIRIAALQRQAELMGAMALFLKIKAFITRETYTCFSDAMMLVAPQLNISTIAYQYSNMNVITPFMMTTADKFLIFSDMYRKVFQYENIKPQKFITVGYLYDGIARFVKDKAMVHRDKLQQSGANFIVCYFDEAVQHNRWGLVSKEDHLGELHTLAKAVLDDSTIGVVIKSQFMFNSPSQMYPDDMLIMQAKKTGRYLELMEGFHRNEIYPAEAALVSDLCISHKFGATAALEAAVTGLRTVLIDPYGTKTLFDSIYSKADIEYETLELLMFAIEKYRQGDMSKRHLGDWSKIIHFFDSHLEGNAVSRLKSEVESCIL